MKSLNGLCICSVSSYVIISFHNPACSAVWTHVVIDISWGPTCAQKKRCESHALERPHVSPLAHVYSGEAAE